MIRLAAFTRYGRRAASTRQRFLQYFPALRAAGIEVQHHPLLGDDYVAGLGTGRAYPRGKVIGAYGQRMAQLLESRGSDLLWVYVELLPYVPPLIERLVTTGKRIVYDFDDAFFHSYQQSGSALVRGLLGQKHGRLLRHAAAACCGNAYLLDYAERYCPNSIILPTVVDTALYRQAETQRHGPLTIGWIGSPPTWCGVRPLLPLLAQICDQYQARFLAVGPGPQARADLFPGMELREWSEEREIADVQEMDVGIMPLLDRSFERGKSGYKLIQYMACGLPVVASPVGVNAEIVKQNVNGFLASTDQQWQHALSLLLDDQERRKTLGRAGRAQAVQSFSLTSQALRLVDLFKSLV